MKIDEKTLRQIIREELMGHQNTNEPAVNHAYAKLASALDEAVDLAGFLMDQAEVEQRIEEAGELEEVLLSLTKVVSTVGTAMTKRSVKNKRSRFHVVK